MIKVSLSYKCLRCGKGVVEKEEIGWRPHDDFLQWVNTHSNTALHECAEGKLGKLQLVGADYESRRDD
jgi:hypothetical protein